VRVPKEIIWDLEVIRSAALAVTMSPEDKKLKKRTARRMIAAGRLHPRVRHRNPDSAEKGAQRHHTGGKEVHSRSDLVPAEDNRKPCMTTSISPSPMLIGGNRKWNEIVRQIFDSSKN
jgi:hypothetical protein